MFLSSHPSLFPLNSVYVTILVEIAQNEKMWVNRSRNCSILVTILWLTWILLVQVIFPEKLPSSLYVRVPDQGEYTGWSPKERRPTEEEEESTILARVELGNVNNGGL